MYMNTNELSEGCEGDKRSGENVLEWTLESFYTIVIYDGVSGRRLRFPTVQGMGAFREVQLQKHIQDLYLPLIYFFIL